MREWAWLDNLFDNWHGILLGTAGALMLQALLGLVSGYADIAVQPLLGLVFVELTVGTGSFVAGLLATEASAMSGTAVAVVLALVSLVAFSMRNPLGGDLLGFAFVLGSYSFVGTLGGAVAGRVQSWWRGRHAGEK